MPRALASAIEVQERAFRERAGADAPIVECAHMSERDGYEAALEALSVEEPRPDSLVCIGAGPASLTVARDLAPLGYDVTVFDGDPKAGGMIRSQIPRFRLPEEVIDEEVGYILDLGVSFVNRKIESMKALMAEGYDAIFVGSGAPSGRDPALPGRR